HPCRHDAAPSLSGLRVLHTSPPATDDLTLLRGDKNPQTSRFSSGAVYRLRDDSDSLCSRCSISARNTMERTRTFNVANVAVTGTHEEHYRHGVCVQSAPTAAGRANR